MSDFELMNTPEKIQYLYEKLNKIKPECFIEESEEEHPVKCKPLGDFWVNLKDADEYYWSDYSYEDFVVGLWHSDPNLAHYSENACDRAVGFPAIDVDVIPKKPEQWDFGDNQEAPSWFNEDNIKEGNIWVKLLCVHADPEDYKKEDDD